jgi:DNA (cytosine-5)-methyltransferase 1
MCGIERGIEQSGTRLSTVAYVEREAFPIYNLVAQMEAGMVDTAPIWTDLKTFNAAPFRGKVHGIVGGYPCQGESLAGKRALDKDERYIWNYIRESIPAIDPLFCFFENVPGHLSGTFKYVLKDLQNLGYAVEAGIFSAAEVGATHIRERIFILACSDIRAFRQCLANSGGANGANSKKLKWGTSSTTSLCSNILGNTFVEGLPFRNEQRIIGETARTSEGKKSFRANKIPSVFSNAPRIRSTEGNGNKPSRQLNQNGTQWPAPPGHRQYYYEAPRTAESGLGCTIDGYNFRIDLLRMLGNGVVPQTAAKAWITLTNKMTS